MKNLKKIINKGNLDIDEIDQIISVVKQEYWPRLQNKPMPKHCGDCDLLNLCKVVNSNLVCPWYLRVVASLANQ